MPEILPIGWFHTIVAIIAILAGLAALAKDKLITSKNMRGKVFLVGTFLAAVTALMIFQHGAFGPGHGLAIMALIAIVGGLITEHTNLFGKLSPYLQAMAYSGIFLFHMIPAITDGLLRLPVGDPVITTINDPLLLSFYGLFLACYVIGLGLQWRTIKRENAA